MAVSSKNLLVSTISDMGISGLHSIMGSNARKMNDLFDMNVGNVFKMWNTICEQSHDDIRTCEQIKELCVQRDSGMDAFFDRSMCNDFIDYLYTT